MQPNQGPDIASAVLGRLRVNRPALLIASTVTRAFLARGERAAAADDSRSVATVSTNLTLSSDVDCCSVTGTASALGADNISTVAGGQATHPPTGG
jgi:hypothetical protein